MAGGRGRKMWAGRGMGKEGAQKRRWNWLPSFLVGLERLMQASEVCTTELADSNSRSPIEQAGTLFGVMERMSPSSKETVILFGSSTGSSTSHLAAQCWLGLDYPVGGNCSNTD